MRKILTILFLSASFFGYSQNGILTPKQLSYTDNKSTFRVYDIKSLAFGAIADRKILFDGAMTSGSANLVSSSSSFTSNDIGKYVRVPGAFTAGADLVIQIASVTNATTVVLMTTASLTVSADTVVYGTDNTVAIQNAILMADAHGGGVIYGDGAFVVAGALQTSVGGQNPNSQIYWPGAGLDNNRKRFHLKGPTGPNFTQSLFANTPLAVNGFVIESLIDGSGNMPSVFGALPVSGGLNFNYITYENVTILVPLNKGTGGPKIGGINNYWGTALEINNVHVGADGGANSLTSAPSDFSIAGIITNKPGSDDIISISNTSVELMPFGIVANEHAKLTQTEMLYCTYGLVLPHSNYPVHGDLVNIQWSVHSIYVPSNTILGVMAAGSANLNIDLLSLEIFNTGSHWYNAVDEFSDTSNNAGGSLYFDVYQAGTGTKINNSFIKTGGANFQCWPIGMANYYWEVPYNFRVGSFGIQTVSATNIIISNNGHLNQLGNGFIYDTTGAASYIGLNGGSIIGRTAVSGTGGNAITYSTAVSLNPDKSGGIGGAGTILGSTGYWLNWTTTGNFTPAANNTQDFGASATRWATMYGVTGNFTNLTISGSAYTVATAVNTANYTITAGNTYTILSDLTGQANRTVTLPSSPTSGTLIFIENDNVSGTSTFNWTFSGTVKDNLGITITTIPDGFVKTLVYTGSFYRIQN